ncbi:MAG: hypothetical protein L0271_17485 [Gemmatimonadetes bacterium]|nr:hypothetical protein [Gemmatimonadota bacterium]
MSGFDRDERHRIEQAIAAGEPPDCPRCALPLERRPVDPGPAVAYVRHRVLLLCARCGGHASVDQPRDARDAAR